MIHEQIGSAFIAALLGQDVSINQIEHAVKVCEDLRVGQSILQQAILEGPPILSKASYAISDYCYATYQRIEAI